MWENKNYSIIFFFFFSVCDASLATQQLPAIPSNGTVNFNVYLSNVQDAKSMNNIALNTAQIKKEIAKTPLLDLVAPQMQKLQNQMQLQSQSFFSTYKWHLALSAILCSYALLCYNIIRGNYYLNRADLWSSWQSTISFDNLLAIPQETFTQDLLREIQRRYAIDTTITDLVTPLSSFINALQEEQETLKWYQELDSWINFLHANKLVPANKLRYSKIAERLQRLAYFKNIFQTWAANYKIEQSCKSHDVVTPEYHSFKKVQTVYDLVIWKKIHSLWLLQKINRLPEYR